LLDIIRCPELMKILKPVLECPTMTKVIHDCREDQAALFYQYEIVLENVMDTQV